VAALVDDIEPNDMELGDMEYCACLNHSPKK
jgi:hypothetical protein